MVHWAQQHGLTEVPPQDSNLASQPRALQCSTGSSLVPSSVPWHPKGKHQMGGRGGAVRSRTDLCVTSEQRSRNGLCGCMPGRMTGEPSPTPSGGHATPESPPRRIRPSGPGAIKTFHGRVRSLSPFEATTAVNDISSRVAQRLAPRAVGYLASGLRQHPYMFRGHRALKRKINCPHLARKIVKRVLYEDTSFWRPAKGIRCEKRGRHGKR